MQRQGAGEVERGKEAREANRKGLLYLYDCQAKPCKDDDGASAKIAGKDPLAGPRVGKWRATQQV